MGKSELWRRLRLRENLQGYRFLLPWIIGFTLFTAAPLAQTFQYSLSNVKVAVTGIELAAVGWQNYTRALFTDPTFVQLLIEYLIEMAISVPIILIFSLIIALFLNVPFWGRSIFRTIFFLPVVITSGPVIGELVAQGATSAPQVASSAAVTAFVAQLPALLREPVQYLLTSFILILWFSGVQILIYLAGLQKIDRFVYEAAAVDGASAWETFWKITLPALTTTTLINALYTVITLSHFSENKVIKYIAARIYDVEGGIGYASAMAFLYSLALIVLLVATFMVLRPRVKD
ncbi:carbohydrate ABC transporter permease [Chloroflexus aggregans]|uniref:Binding-protein-dependent transport systems inner membrane component n=1 Tax=Chloroflexus aggregans (strain MD-66 / DSM 9485) TaxID=326427 RepID=B8GC63_CHLAD|nr:sugar ABC transporter permease [Chloroflexus aggregans]ACL23037.1 binding-protein-dependent transport systems inner membrane component [Chloroflexus aggregans DSM 9485]